MQCADCRKVLTGNKIKLRDYLIPLKHVADLHF